MTVNSQLAKPIRPFLGLFVINGVSLIYSRLKIIFTLYINLANRPLPPPELSIMDDAVFVQNPEYLSQQSYWKSFNIVNASLYYEFPTKAKIK